MESVPFRFVSFRKEIICVFVTKMDKMSFELHQQKATNE